MQEVFEKIITEIENEITAAGCGLSRVYALQTALDIVRKHSDNNGWIPCSERLPESKKGVLVNYKNGDFAVDFMHEDGKWFWEDEEEGLVVIAWQPLPAPYKPKGEES